MSDFSLQYHLTARCSYNCGHCYLREASYSSELLNEHDTKTSLQVIDDFQSLCIRLSRLVESDINPVIHFTGGDPLLRSDIFELINECTVKHIKVGVLGNPDLITAATAKKLVDAGTLSYQISIDGPEEYHDNIRKRGSYASSLRAIEVLADAGIKKIHVMYNVTAKNIDHVADTYRSLLSSSATGFVFARVACTGNAKDLDLQIDPLRYKKLLQEMDGISSSELKLVHKDPLWAIHNSTLLRFEPTRIDIDGGCMVGISLLTVMSDGTVHACRRMSSPLGTVPQDSLYNLFIGSPVLSKFRDFSNYVKCRSCSLVNNCRGCPAVAYGQTGDYFTPDPQCWL